MNMNKKELILLLLLAKKALVLMLVLAAPFSLSVWTEDVEVHVVDSKLRGIEGASVEIHYQREKFPLTSGVFDGLSKGNTDYNGAYRTTITDVVTPEESIVREYVVFGAYLGRTTSTTVKCNSNDKSYCSIEQPKVLMLQLPAYKLTVIATDQNGAPLQGASIRVGSITRASNSQGAVEFMLIAGEQQTVYGTYSQMTSQTTAKLTNDSTVHVVFPMYEVQLTIVDENGTPVQAKVMGAGTTMHSDADGRVRFRAIPLYNVTFTIEANKRIKTVEYRLTKNLDEKIVFDTSAPVFRSVEVKRESEDANPIVTVFVEDVGRDAVGLRQNQPIILVYSVNGSTSKQIEMYPVSSKEFRTALPKYDTADYAYSIRAYDGDGNLAVYEGTYSVRSKNIVNNTTENNTGVAAAPSEGGVNWVMVIGGVLFLVILIFVVKKWKEESG